jgi:hypothetical protein
VLAEPLDHRSEAAIEMPWQKQVPHDQPALPQRYFEIALNNFAIAINAGQSVGTIVVPKLEISDVNIRHAAQELKRLGCAVKIGFPNDWRKRRTIGHHVEQRGKVNSRLPTNPLDISSTLLFAPCDRFIKKFAG